MHRVSVVLGVWLLASAASLYGQPSPPAASEQIASFQLPPGFEMQLVVSDPEVGQPMNLNFDARGRLWITHSVEYPFPAQGEGVEPRSASFPGVGQHPPRDRLTVVAGIGTDGRPTRVSHFVGGLNIPIGHAPIGDGNTAVVYGIPSIFHCQDQDGDGTADTKTTLYSRFGNVDVHGNASSFTRWIDGWIYGCHGFSNTSHIRDGAGNVTTLRSGNTYRFRADGSQFELFARGQTNPFGLTFDPLGNLYSSDCHSMPIYLLLRGASYPGIGAAPDALDYGPTMIDHNHGSTGICGPAYYAADHFPPEFRDNIFICNPVTGRVHRDKLKRHGSTYQCDTQPDFITTSDPWFRPVDAIVGPDGALYIADFCNLVIGHYEAPLDHPDRDRTHGRVWRIVWRGEDGQAPAPAAMPDLTKLSAQKLADQLANPNLLVRTLATNCLLDLHPSAAPELAAEILSSSQDAFARAHAIWVFERTVRLEDAAIQQTAADADPLVRVHLMRALAERETWTENVERVVRSALQDADAFVRRAAVDAVARHPQHAWVAPLLAAWQNASPDDTHLIHSTRMALRDHVSDQRVVAQLLMQELDETSRSRLLQIAARSENRAAAPLLLKYADSLTPEVLRQTARQIARYGSREHLSLLIEKGPTWFPDDPLGEVELLAATAQALSERGNRPSDNPQLRGWLMELVPRAFAELARTESFWQALPLPGSTASASPFGLRKRTSADGDGEHLFLDSIVNGESLTGTLRSRPFVAPQQLSFWMCGHNGHPESNDSSLNRVQLVRTDTGEVIAREFPPRSDTAQKYTWKLSDYAGKPVRFEMIDAHSDDAFAWIAVARFEPPILDVALNTDRFASLFGLVREFQFNELESTIAKFACDPERDVATRLAGMETLERLDLSTASVDMLIQIAQNSQEPSELRGKTVRVLGRRDTRQSQQALTDLLPLAAGPLQRDIATALSQSAAGARALVTLIEQGKASALLLTQPAIAAGIEKYADADTQRQSALLAADLPPTTQEAMRKVAARIASFDHDQVNLARGLQVYRQHCAACHRIGDIGDLVGPQLDGIGNRGAERIFEDILDPNRNVDVAFRMSVFVLVDGRIISGLERPREGEVIVVADPQGELIRFPAHDVEVSRRTNLSLMPNTLGESLPPADLHDLVAWLLSVRTSATDATP